MNILITGVAGFIGFHLAKSLLKSGHKIFGVDNLCDYYSVELKKERLKKLKQSDLFEFDKVDISENTFVDEYSKKNIDVIIHLAAQAGVRYSIENPSIYAKTNLIGTHNVLEIARQTSPLHTLMASTSSVYGANENMPFKELDKTEHPLSYYSATKKSNELMAHSYSYTYDIPVTMFRFFTVYGPAGRPDMALYKFVSSIIAGKPIDVYNNGEMMRDFTYVDDLVFCIQSLISCIPQAGAKVCAEDSVSSVAAHRVVNIGNSTKVKLFDFISEIEKALDMRATCNMLPMQLGDVKETESDTRLLQKLIGFTPTTPIDAGIKSFIDWYRDSIKREL